MKIFFSFLSCFSLGASHGYPEISLGCLRMGQDGIGKGSIQDILWMSLGYPVYILTSSWKVVWLVIFGNPLVITERIKYLLSQLKCFEHTSNV